MLSPSIRLRDAIEGMFEHEDLDTSDDEGEFRKAVGEKKCELIAEELREIKAQRMEKAADKKERKQKRKMEKAQQGECIMKYRLIKSLLNRNVTHIRNIVI